MSSEAMRAARGRVKKGIGARRTQLRFVLMRPHLDGEEQRVQGRVETIASNAIAAAHVARPSSLDCARASERPSNALAAATKARPCPALSNIPPYPAPYPTRRPIQRSISRAAPSSALSHAPPYPTPSPGPALSNALSNAPAHAPPFTYAGRGYSRLGWRWRRSGRR